MENTLVQKTHLKRAVKSASIKDYELKIKNLKPWLTNND